MTDSHLASAWRRVAALLAVLFGLVGLAFKVLLFGLVAYFIYRLVRGRKHETHETV